MSYVIEWGPSTMPNVDIIKNHVTLDVAAFLKNYIVLSMLTLKIAFQLILEQF